MAGFSRIESAPGVPRAGPHLARGAEAKRSSPDVTQMEISVSLLTIWLPGLVTASLGSSAALETVAAASPRTDISRKSRREVLFFIGLLLVMSIHQFFGATDLPLSAGTMPLPSFTT